MDDKATIISCIALLDQHRKIHNLSVAMTVLSAGLLLASVLFFPSPPILCVGAIIAIILLGLAEIWFAIRVGFDQQLLSSMVTDPENLQPWDQALIRLKLMPAAKAGRALDERLRGCIGLLKMQAMLLVAQLATAMIGLLSYRLLF